MCLNFAFALASTIFGQIRSLAAIIIITARLDEGDSIYSAFTEPRFDTAEEGVIERAKAGNYELNRYQVPADQLARWTKLAGEPIWEEWIKKMEGKGHKDARDILNSALDSLKN